MICKTDTHYYDGKLWSDSPDVKEEHKQLLRQLKEDIESVKRLDKEVKLQVFNNLLTFIAADEEASQYRTARACINTIVRDFEANPTYGSGPNYDPRNELQADDLLYLCAGKILVDPESESKDESTRDFISVEEVVFANTLLGMQDKQVMNGDSFNIATGRSINLLELVALLKKEFPSYTKQVNFQPARQGDIKRSGADTSKWKSLSKNYVELSKGK